MHPTIQKPERKLLASSVALKSGLVHLVLAGCSLGLAAWLAVKTSGGRCSDVNSCLEVGLKLISFSLVGYALAFTIWGIALHRLLGSVSANAARRTSTAAALQLGLGATLLLVGIAVGDPWAWVSFAVAAFLLPAISAWWAVSRPETEDVFVPWWRRAGW